LGGKITRDVRATRPFAAVLTLSAAVSGLAGNAPSRDIHGAVTDHPMAGHHRRSNRRVPEYGYEPLEGVGNLLGGSLRQRSDALANQGGV
jgi:hypothetical protein